MTPLTFTAKYLHCSSIKNITYSKVITFLWFPHFTDFVEMNSITGQKDIGYVSRRYFVFVFIKVFGHITTRP